jgi:hypothetical protein
VQQLANAPDIASKSGHPKLSEFIYDDEMQLSR